MKDIILNYKLGYFNINNHELISLFDDNGMKYTHIVLNHTNNIKCIYRAIVLKLIIDSNIKIILISTLSSTKKNRDSPGLNSLKDFIYNNDINVFISTNSMVSHEMYLADLYLAKDLNNNLKVLKDRYGYFQKYLNK